MASLHADLDPDFDPNEVVDLEDSKPRSALHNASGTASPSPDFEVDHDAMLTAALTASLRTGNSQISSYAMIHEYCIFNIVVCMPQQNP